MAAQAGPAFGGNVTSNFSYSNGYERETAILDSGETPNPSMEDMLKEATDMQSGRGFSSGRLELRSDETQSPFQQHYPTPSPSLNYSGTYDF